MSTRVCENCNGSGKVIASSVDHYGDKIDCDSCDGKGSVPVRGAHTWKSRRTTRAGSVFEIEFRIIETRDGRVAQKAVDRFLRGVAGPTKVQGGLVEATARRVS